VGGSVQALRDYVRFLRMIRQVRPAVVHICTSAGPALRKDLLMLQAARKRGIPSIIHYRMGRIPDIYGDNSQRSGTLLRASDSARATGATKDSPEAKLLRMCTTTATTSLVLDRRSLMCLRKVCPNANVRLMPNMVDVQAVDSALAAYEPPPETRLAVSFVGHVLESKGAGDLVRACASSGLGIVLHMVGPTEEQYRRELEAVVAGSPLELRFHGTLSHEESLRTIASGDIFALPSHSEGFPNVVAEAMACSRPVLGSAVGAIPDMLNVEGAEPCGVCVPPGNTDALAEALLRLASDGDLRRRMGMAGRRRVETEYALNVVTNKLVALWRELAECSH